MSLGGGVSKNHHPKSISTPPKKSAALIFNPAEPISALEYLCRFDPTLYRLPPLMIYANLSAAIVAVSLL